MKDRIIMIAALLFIAACALITFARINSAYNPPDAPAVFPSPGPLVPTDTATATTATAPASTAAGPGRTVTVTVSTTPPPVQASTGGEDGQ